MNLYFKQSISIICLALLISFIRFSFISNDFNILKISRISDISLSITEIERLNNDNLKEYLNNNLINPTFIPLSLVNKIYKNNLATFIDARSFEEYNEKHIKKAINIPFDSINQIEKDYDLIWMNQLNENYTYKIENLENEFIIGIEDELKFIRNPENYNTNTTLSSFETIFVIYCSGEGCSLSEDLAFYMFDQLGFNKILIYEGGMSEWIKEGFPTNMPDSAMPAVVSTFFRFTMPISVPPCP
mgnify:CR=1 FL=1